MVLNGEAGNDKFSYATTTTNANIDLVTIAGGAGTDTLYISGGAVFGLTATVSGVEAITFANTIAGATTLAWTGGSTDIVTITELNTDAEMLTITTVAGSGVLNTSNWSWLGWAAGDKLSLTGDTGNDVLTGTIGLDTITGGAGNDAINVGATDGVSDRVVFSAPASNGSDTITNFNAVTGATGDILYSRDFTFVAGTAADTALNAANTAACDNVSEFADNVVAVNATEGVTAVTWQAAANTGNIDTTLFSRLLVLDIGATANIYYVENTTVADDNSVSITLLGTFSDIGTITGGITFVAANFDFIA
ncbi:hypothetical protein CXB77_10035 [Chromatium okenii]|uniref:Calcium-binding protein n=1 Tax=Chromatium okenii TaxID=61644 RepID=A0A2S7XRP6_9GAMM|nr:hypothetical protein CXB77_10035 [Chromatium okenii]